MSVLLGEQTSPFYTIATLIPGKSSTFRINVRLDEGVKYVFKVDGPNPISLLGYHPQDIEAGAQSTRPPYAHHGCGSPYGNVTLPSSGPALPVSPVSTPHINNSGSTHLQPAHSGSRIPSTPSATTTLRPDVPAPPNESVSNPGQMDHLVHPGGRVRSSASTTTHGPLVSAPPPGSVPNPNRMEHLAPQSGYMWTSNSGGPAAKKVKGEDGRARRQSLKPIDDGDEFERPAGSSSNKRKAVEKIDPSCT
ncbi:hypothetical protein F5879DRAFT_993822 [Lentinula edodes]|nr:hypothetical protein F5879DRAFT_993822 [Lentinula edodes]